MAEKNLSSIIKSAASHHARLIKTSVGSSSNSVYNPKEDVEKLRRIVLRIRATLDDAEERDVIDEAVKLWLEELKDLAYDAEDISDEYDYEVLRSKVEGQNKIETTHKRKREEGGDRIKKIRERFDEITHDRNALCLTEEDGEKLFDKAAKRPPTTSFVQESAIYGRKQDKEKVIELLLAEDGSSQCGVSVIPIIGMGGIGKTTVAQLVYNDRRVCLNFNQRGWVCVSENFDVSRLLKEIFESLTKQSCNQMNTDIVCDNLRRQLNGKRFLLILDDVWNEKLDLWESVKAPLSGVGIGKIIVTTRHVSVSRIMQTTPPYRLSCLPDDICWLLFRGRAFEGRDLEEYANLEGIGKEIVRKCRGLPLAVKTLGGLLRFETDEERWTDILESDLLDLDEQKDDILPALKLSYIRMPAHLKPCFMYCSLFPKDYQFEKDEIIWLWMSQGLILSKGRQQLEHIGNGYFEELIWRSFFQRPETPKWKEVYVMHDLLHDLSEYVARQECHKIERSLGCNAPKRIRHLGFCFSSSFLNLNLPKTCKDLRTLLLCPQQQGRIASVEIGIDSFQNLTCLRTLDLRCSLITELPDSIGSLKQLRYLCLKYSNISRLPDSVCCLYNLLILDLYKSGIKELPKDMKNLINLRHLVSRDESFCLPPCIGQITSLRTLSGFKVGRVGEHCGIGELKDLVHLKGTLVISGLENVASLGDAKDAKMDNKKHLEALTFAWSQEPVANLQDLAYDEYTKQMLENLRPHTNLKELKIWRYRGSKSPSWLCDPNFPKMVYVELSDFRPSFTLLPPLGQLPSLKNLFIGRMSGVVSVGREFCVGDFATANGFPSLERLEFSYMREWVEWHGVEDGDFPCLQKLEIRWCQKLRSLPACNLPSLKELVIIDCEELGALPTLTSLTTLHLGSQRLCASISSLNLPSLQELTVCSRIAESLTLRHGSFPLLRKLSFITCRNLGSIHGLESLASLEHLCITGCPRLHFSVDDQPPPMLQRVDVSSCPGLREWCQRQGIQYI